MHKYELKINSIQEGPKKPKELIANKKFKE